MIRYALAWLLVGGTVAVLAVVLGGTPERPALPPVRETDLGTAARKARCTLRSSGRSEPGLRVTGAPSRPAAPGIYDPMPSVTSLVGAVRRGIVVIHYRPTLPTSRIEQLRALHATVPNGTVVTPNAQMPYEVAVTAWRRLLGCARFDARAFDALRLFGGRYVGSGPDSER